MLVGPHGPWGLWLSLTCTCSRPLSLQIRVHRQASILNVPVFILGNRHIIVSCGSTFKQPFSHFPSPSPPQPPGYQRQHGLMFWNHRASFLGLSLMLSRVAVTNNSSTENLLKIQIPFSPRDTSCKLWASLSSVCCNLTPLKSCKQTFRNRKRP